VLRHCRKQEYDRLPTIRGRSTVADELLEKGVAIRSDMFGQVRLTGAAGGFNEDFEQLVNEYCFGAVWGREGLSRAQRSMLTIAILATEGRPEELKAHVRGALSNGVSREEIREVLIHTAVYAGVPAGVGGFRAAAEVFASLENES
jgi:4-carboxymuconolactone decarboxylase